MELGTEVGTSMARDPSYPIPSAMGRTNRKILRQPWLNAIICATLAGHANSAPRTPTDSMPRQKKLTQAEIEKVVVLFAVQGKTQVDIAERLGISQSSVSTALRKARDDDLLEERPRCLLDRRRVSELEQLVYSPDLFGFLAREQPAGRPHLLHVRIFDRDLGDDAFARFAADHLSDEVFPAAERVGVAWGRTLQRTFENLEGPPPRRRRPPIRVFPVCGSPPDANSRAHQASSRLVTLVDEHVNGIYTNKRNYNGVGAAIPISLQGPEEEGVRRYFDSIEGYRLVFGGGAGQAPLIETVDTVLTGVGTNEVRDDPWVKGAAQSAGFEPEELERHTIGNIGGWFFPRPGHPEDQRYVDTANQRWTGIQEPHFASCAARAAKRGSGGVVVVAAGPKEDIVLECIRRGLVSQLVIDQELARALRTRLAATA